MSSEEREMKNLLSALKKVAEDHRVILEIVAVRQDKSGRIVLEDATVEPKKAWGNIPDPEEYWTVEA